MLDSDSELGQAAVPGSQWEPHDDQAAQHQHRFELGGINHVALVCSDMARTVDFYSNILGMPLIKALDPARRPRAALLL